jgi:hypothetical protein
MTLNKSFGPKLLTVMFVHSYPYQIPGVASKPLPQPMQLHLRVVEPSSALQVLQSRHWDMEASRFMTHQSHRFSIL